MTYSQIIQDNCLNKSSVTWWPKFAFHYTDISNAVSILSLGVLYSRVNAEKMALMQNDNASRQVIDMTQTEAIANVRFYFRPKTPTQYHNEGFKHNCLRYDRDPEANVPVPVFFIFDLNKLLTIPETSFSNRALSGNGAEIQKGVDAFANLDFFKIYSNGAFGPEGREVIGYRHAEIIYPNSFQIDSCIQGILCRNNVEKTTLLNLLKQNNMKSYYKYKELVKVCKIDMFYNNGLYVVDCTYHDGIVAIAFSDTQDKLQYAEKMMQKYGIDSLPKISVRVGFEWYRTSKNNDEVINYYEAVAKIDYLKATPIVFKDIPISKEAKGVRIRVFFEDKMMCLYEQPLAEIEMI